jgi:hypothetical protein
MLEGCTAAIPTPAGARSHAAVNLVYTAGRFVPIKLRVILDFPSGRLKARLAR